MKKSLIMFLAFGLVSIAAPAFAAWQTITNDTWWKDASGNPIYALGGGVSEFGSTYYWYGVQYGGMATYYSTGTAGSDTSFVQVNCYSSTDLVHWTKQNPSVTTSTSGFSDTSWVGRMGSVLYNSSSGKYVMWIEYSGSNGTGMACLTSSSPTGSFTLNNVQTNIANVYHNIEGDSTIFCDVDHSSTPYLIFSDSHGREHAYISPLSSNYETINSATLISEWPQGQEANNMFERSGVYYYLMSNLAGWSYSSAYQVNSTSILTPSSYTADAAFAGTTADYTHHSQVSFVIPVAGSSTTSYICAGDRWSCFDSSYESAGFGTGFNEWCPVTFSGSTPTYNSLASFQIDTSTGDWQTTGSGGSGSGLANGTYEILNLHSGLALDAFAQGKTDGTKIDQWAWNDGENQEWTVTSLGSGEYSIVGVQSGLDVTSPSSTEGAQLELESSSGSTSQTWVITPAATSDYYTVQCVANSYLMDDYANETTNGTPTDQWPSTGGANQEWSFTPQ